MRCSFSCQVFIVSEMFDGKYGELSFAAYSVSVEIIFCTRPTALTTYMRHCFISFSCDCDERLGAAELGMQFLCRPSLPIHQQITWSIQLWPVRSFVASDLSLCLDLVARNAGHHSLRIAGKVGEEKFRH